MHSTPLNRIWTLVVFLSALFQSESVFSQQTSSVPGEVLVYLAKDARASDVQVSVGKALPRGARVSIFKSLGAESRYFLLGIQSAAVADADLEKIVANSPGVEATSLNYVLKYNALPNDTQYGDQWGMQDAHVEEVWNFTTGGSMANGRRIAVGFSDTRIETTHPDLQGNIWPDSPAQGNGDLHGTAVASVVGAVGNNSEGITGVNWDVDLVSIGAAFDLSDVIEIFEHGLLLRQQFNASNGLNGALVVSVTASWGTPDAACSGFSFPLFHNMALAGILVITAGPNDSSNLDVEPDFPSNCALAEHLVVSAIGQAGEVPFAIGANSVHLLAPGLDIPVADENNGYLIADGNSFAVPYVAGAIALLYSIPCPDFAALVMNDPQAARTKVKNAILNNTTSVSGGNALCITGGKLNVLAAYEALMAECPPCDTLTITYTSSGNAPAQASLVNGSGTEAATSTNNVLRLGCAANGCYSATFLESNGDPVSGTWTVESTLLGSITSGSSVDGTLAFNFGTVLSGCTDPGASNYNPEANCDDGTCCAQQAVAVYLVAQDVNATGTAYLQIVSAGNTVFDGPVQINSHPTENISYGEVSLCLPSGCLDLFAQETDVVLDYGQAQVGTTQQYTFDIGVPTTVSAGSPAPELCDGLDNDCDGVIDEDFFWYTDADADGVGDDSTLQVSCTPMPGLVQVGGDCNDGDANLTFIGAPCNDGDPLTNNDVVRADCTCLGLLAGECPDGEITDCNGNCAPLEWVGNGFCDNGSSEWNGNLINFNCAEFNNDGGDCANGCTTEVCDGIDNDCDGFVDEDFIWFTDADGDGFGDDETAQISCIPVFGGVQIGGDCNDTDPAVSRSSTLYVLTEDPDGFGTAHYVIQQGGTSIEGDLDLTVESQGLGELSMCLSSSCFTIAISQNDVPLLEESYYRIGSDDVIAFITTEGYQGGGSAEVCDGIDNNCDGQIDEDGVCGCPPAGTPCDDGNACTFNETEDGACNCGDALNAGPIACDDGDPNTTGDTCFNGICIGTIMPPLDLCDGIDNDGDGLIDEDFVQEPCGCGGITVCVSGHVECVGSLASPEICDGLDNDCNGMIDEGLGLGEECGCGGVVICDGNGGVTCSISLIEICDGIDNDCDGLVDEGGVCTDELCDGIDNDGDGLIDAADPDLVLVFCEMQNGVCSGAIKSADRCVNGTWLSCTPDDYLQNSQYYSPIGELCDGLDNDCDGQVDEGAGGFADTDGDGFGDPLQPLSCAAPGVANSLDCDDTNANIRPDALEICDGIDNNCNGQIDEGGVCGCAPAGTPCDDGNPCTFNETEDGACNCGDALNAGPIACDDGDPNTTGDTCFNGLCIGTVVPTLDLCDGIDNDGDGLIDEDFVQEPCGCGGITVCVNGHVECSGSLASPEICDGLDNDCDGMIDEGLGLGEECGCGGVLVCDGNGGVTCSVSVIEICDGIDNNCDGQVDEGFATCCTDYILEFQSGGINANAVTYEILDEAGTTTVLSGNNPVPANGIGTQTLCLADGCYQLRVTDASGGGLVGYVLRETGANGRRFIDNKGNMSNGVSQISSNGTFCIPISDIDLIHSSCDKLDWVDYKYLVCHADPLVSAEWVPSGANNVQDANSGYEFWIFDPNGTYSYRKFRSHNVSDGKSPANATRACHMKINNWYNSALTPLIPQNTLLNVRVRSRVNGTNFAFGPACTMKLDAARAACPLVKLQDDPTNTSDYSCGVTRSFGGTNTGANKITALPPQFSPAPFGGGTGVHFQFRFRIPAEGICIVLPPQTSPTRYLNWNSTVASPLLCSKTYEVDVRVSKNGGNTWCTGGPANTACSDGEPWGLVCNVTIGCGGTNFIYPSPPNLAQGSLTLYPNPNRGDQFFVSITTLAPEVDRVTMDLFDLTGKRITSQILMVKDGQLNTKVDLRNELGDGLYLVQFRAGSSIWSQRLVIAH